MRRSSAAGSLHPFIKWAGGKSQLLTDLLALAPPSFESYYEPFVGGGALFFALSSKGQISKAHLNDLNHDLICVYKVIQSDVTSLLESLAKLQAEYSQAESKSDLYYSVRSQRPVEPVDLASRFIFLNKTGYNGLYRVNSRGEFNVPFGRYKNPSMYDEANLRAVSQSLQSATLSAEPFEAALCSAKAGDFVYFDPPYQPVSATANFTGYTSSRFNMVDQIRLAEEFDRLSRIGVKVMLSNSDHAFIEGLFEHKGYNITTVQANRQINSNPQRRGAVAELIVRNYD